MILATGMGCACFSILRERICNNSRVEIRFEVETRQLGTEATIAYTLEYAVGYAQRIALVVDDIHLLFDANPLNIALDEILFDHALERANVIEHRAYKNTRSLFIQSIMYPVFAH